MSSDQESDADLFYEGWGTPAWERTVEL